MTFTSIPEKRGRAHAQFCSFTYVYDKGSLIVEDSNKFSPIIEIHQSVTTDAKNYSKNFIFKTLMVFKLK